MGVASSLRQIYAEAHQWFRIYIDKDTYVGDFEELDKLGNGGVTFGAIQTWVAAKAEQDPESCWATFRKSGVAMMMSHKAAAMHMDSSSSVNSKKVVDITEFKAFLIHLYANTILWRHYIACYEGTGEDDFKKKLSIREFSLACKSLCDVHAKETLTKAQLREDFQMLDENCDGLIGFVQICAFCCRYINEPGVEGASSNSVVQDHHDINSKASKILGLKASSKPESDEMDEKVGIVRNVMGEFKAGKAVFAHLSTEEKTDIAMEQVKRKIEKEDRLLNKYHTARHVSLMVRDEPDSCPSSLHSVSESKSSYESNEIGAK